MIRILKSNAQYNLRLRKLKAMAEVKSKQITLKHGLNLLYVNKMLGERTQTKGQRLVEIKKNRIKHEVVS